MNKVAVYGSLREGLHNHVLLMNCEKISTETIQGFDMYCLGSFPVVYKGEGEITIEVYEVPDSTMPSLDGLEGHPDWYRRELVPTSQGEAWLYVMQDEYPEAPKVDSGNWREYLCAD